MSDRLAWSLANAYPCRSGWPLVAASKKPFAPDQLRRTVVIDHVGHLSFLCLLIPQLPNPRPASCRLDYCLVPRCRTPALINVDWRDRRTPPTVPRYYLTAVRAASGRRKSHASPRTTSRAEGTTGQGTYFRLSKYSSIQIKGASLNKPAPT